MLKHLVLIFSLAQFKMTLSHLQGPDWFAIFFALFGIAYGMRKGFVRELVEIAELMTIIFFTFSLHNIIVGVFANSLMISPERIAPLVFLIAAWLIWMAIAFLDKMFSPYFSSKLPNVIKNLGGGILGAFHLFLIWCFFSQAVILIPSPKVQNVYADKQSVTGPIARDFPRKIHQTFAEFLKVPGIEPKA